MASIGTEQNGRKRILFTAADGRRKTLRLGKCSRKQAEFVKVRVEDLIGATQGGGVHEETNKWLKQISDALHARLVRANLTDPRQSAGAGTLEPFLTSYIAGRTDVKENTRIGLGQAKRNLVAFFGESKRLKDITAGDAEEYWRYLIGTQKLAGNTARRLVGRAKQFFRFAMRKGLIQTNPFADLESNVRSNPARTFFVTRETAQKVIDACPDAQWRLLFALSRYGGLRCPSEHLALKWSDVDWDAGRIRVPSPKTEHIEGRESRVIPLFPELLPSLREVFEQRADGAEYVITRYRLKNANLRTQLKRIIKRAKVPIWPKLFHNLRATRQTELADTFPDHVVCAWLGNTEVVARKHYLHVIESHFARALGVARNPTQTAAGSGEQSRAGEDLEVEKHRENTAQDVQSHGSPWPLSGSNTTPYLTGNSGVAAKSGTISDARDLSHVTRAGRLARQSNRTAPNLRASLRKILTCARGRGRHA